MPKTQPSSSGRTSWLQAFCKELLSFPHSLLHRIRHLLRINLRSTYGLFKLAALLWFFIWTLIITVLLWRQQDSSTLDITNKQIAPRATPAPKSPAPTVLPTPDIFHAVRPIPKSFARDSRMPGHREVTYSKPIGSTPFSPKNNIIEIDDPRVWWESDHDKNDTENDHQINRSMEIPLRRLIELVCAENGHLKVQDAYRASGVHTKRSLHKEGRAVDLTCNELGLERLACLCWAAGFDWVYYEASSKGGAHVHASVRPESR